MRMHQGEAAHGGVEGEGRVVWATQRKRTEEK